MLEPPITILLLGFAYLAIVCAVDVVVHRSGFFRGAVPAVLAEIRECLRATTVVPDAMPSVRELMRRARDVRLDADQERLARFASLSTLAAFGVMPALVVSFRCLYAVTGAWDEAVLWVLDVSVLAWVGAAISGWAVVRVLNRVLSPRAACFLDLALPAILFYLLVEGIRRTLHALLCFH